jgi:exodeoxyribonuclease V alpha subunit
VSTLAPDLDLFDIRLVSRAPGLLRDFNAGGVLIAADVHVALRLAELGAERDESVTLALAFAVRAPRLGHVYVDLATISQTATVDTDEPVDLAALPWPSPAAWIEGVVTSTLVAVGETDDVPSRPFRLVDSGLYLDRYWREELQVAADVRALSDRQREDVRVDILAEGLGRLYAGETDSRQCLAAACAVLRRMAVVAGGPGTGKTTTVAAIVALLAEQAEAAASAAPLVALAAPTGKAAARLEEAVHDEAKKLAVDDRIRTELLALQASTLHRLLGSRPDSNSRFRHNRGQRLPHDLVIVDETSMVSLSLMTRLIEAIREDARLVLVGDPGQLVSIEAGAVLGDIVGPSAENLLIDAQARELLMRATGHEVAAEEPPLGVTVGNGIVVLDRVYRFGGGIARLAEAIRRGDEDAALQVLADSHDGVTWIPIDAADSPMHEALAPIREGAVTAARGVMDAARSGDAKQAIDALGDFRLLCAHRRGPAGVATWTALIEEWLADEVDDFVNDERWYVGRPLLVRENDYELQLYNGDTGVVVQRDPDRVTAAFERRGEVVEFSPTRLAAIETVYAMTIHKSQGSQFDTAVVLLPGPTSRILTRELLYTAATRARKELILVGTEETIRAAVTRPVARASGLRWRLWGDPAP